MLENLRFFTNDIRETFHFAIWKQYVSKFAKHFKSYKEKKKKVNGVDSTKVIIYPILLNRQKCLISVF